MTDTEPAITQYHQNHHPTLPAPPTNTTNTTMVPRRDTTVSMVPSQSRGLIIFIWSSYTILIMSAIIITGLSIACGICADDTILFRLAIATTCMAGISGLIYSFGFYIWRRVPENNDPMIFGIGATMVFDHLASFVKLVFLGIIVYAAPSDSTLRKLSIPSCVFQALQIFLQVVGFIARGLLWLFSNLEASAERGHGKQRDEEATRQGGVMTENAPPGVLGLDRENEDVGVGGKPAPAVEGDTDQNQA